MTQTTLPWEKSGAYQAWVNTDKGDYYIWHAVDGKYAIRFYSTEGKKLRSYEGEIVDRCGTVEGSKAAAERHYAGI